MQAIYMNNFRGFTDTWIPLRDVNFLVGENSTGKTSFLALVSLLYDYKFWFRGYFNTEDVQLGGFRDIVSAEARDRDYFEVGYLQFPNAESKRTSPPLAFVLRFIETDGIPVMQRCHVMYKNYAVRADFGSRKPVYATRAMNVSRPGAFALAFKKWVAEGKKPDAYPKKSPSFSWGLERSPIWAEFFWELVVRKSMKPKKTRLARIERGPISVVFAQTTCEWIAPIRTQPRRTYDEVILKPSSGGEHIPYLIRTLKQKKQKGQWPSLRRFLEKFGKESGLFRSVDVHELGKGRAGPFFLEVTLTGKPLNLSHVGYGVSQCLPILVQLFSLPRDSFFAVQQPEIHLHPRAQAALGDFFFKLAATQGKVLLIETHSDFTIDRFRLNYRKATKKPEGQVLFFERSKKGNKVTPLPFTDKGEFPKDQPTSFRDFFLTEQLALLAGD